MITLKCKNDMECELCHWRIEDAKDIAETLNNRKVLDNLRDGIPFPLSLIAIRTLRTP